MSAGVLFDLDETLIDRAASISAYAHLFLAHHREEIALSEHAFVERFLALDGNGAVPRAAFFRALAAQLGSPRIDAAAVARHFAEHAWKAPRLVHGALAALDALEARGVPIAIVTNGGASTQRQKLVNAGLADRVACCVVSEELGVRKPDPAIFLEASARLGVDPRASWFVGDDPVADIRGAGGVGFRTVWLERGNPWPAELETCYTHRATSLDEALEAILAGI